MNASANENTFIDQIVATQQIVYLLVLLRLELRSDMITCVKRLINILNPCATNHPISSHLFELYLIQLANYIQNVYIHILFLVNIYFSSTVSSTLIAVHLSLWLAIRQTGSQWIDSMTSISASQYRYVECNRFFLLLKFLNRIHKNQRQDISIRSISCTMAFYRW